MNLNQRQIIHADLDTFFVSVERLQNPSLEGKPVIVGGQSERGVVSTCSYEARKYGVHSAMAMKTARKLCPDAVFINGNMELYSKFSHLITSIIADKAPVFEKASIDEHYIDVSGMDKYFGIEKWTKELRQTIIKESGLPISMGLSINKTVSKIATGEAKPNGEKFISAEKTKEFLAPLSINKIPGVGEKTSKILQNIGITDINSLSRLPIEMVENILGKNGIILWKKANGIDPTPVQPYSEQKSISTETTFGTDTVDTKMIKRLFIGMTDELCSELRRKENLTSCITVKIRYSNFETQTMQCQIPYTSFDHKIINVVNELFGRLYQRRMLIRLVGIKFSGLVRGGEQLDIFDDTMKKISLYKTIDEMRERFGTKAILRAFAVTSLL